MNIGVINDEGRAVCNAEVSVEVKSPERERSYYSTHEGSIFLSNKCEKEQLTNQADYSVVYIPKSDGVYKVRVSSESSEGIQTWESTFLVTRNAGFIVRYESVATRIFPLSTYIAKMQVRTNRPVIGEIHYDVPSSFKIQDVNAGGKVVQTDAGTQTLVWPIKAETAEVISLSFQYNSQNKNPEFYLFGPLRIIKMDTNEPVKVDDLRRDDYDFAEPHAWEIMADPAVLTESVF